MSPRPGHDHHATELCPAGCQAFGWGDNAAYQGTLTADDAGVAPEQAAVANLASRRERAPNPADDEPSITMFTDEDRIIFRDRAALDEYVHGALDDCDAEALRRNAMHERLVDEAVAAALAANLPADDGRTGQPADKSERLGDAGPVPSASSARRQTPADDGARAALAEVERRIEAEYDSASADAHTDNIALDGGGFVLRRAVARERWADALRIVREVVATLPAAARAEQGDCSCGGTCPDCNPHPFTPDPECVSCRGVGCPDCKQPSGAAALTEGGEQP